LNPANAILRGAFRCDEVPTENRRKLAAMHCTVGSSVVPRIHDCRLTNVRDFPVPKGHASAKIEVCVHFQSPNEKGKSCERRYYCRN
jgi:hypothetical protein